MDASQDWHLLYAREDHCRTVMKVVRKLDTCDDQDYKITASVPFHYTVYNQYHWGYTVFTCAQGGNNRGKGVCPPTLLFEILLIFTLD